MGVSAPVCEVSAFLFEQHSAVCEAAEPAPNQHLGQVKRCFGVFKPFALP